LSKAKLASDYLLRFVVVLVGRTVGLVLVPLLITHFGLAGYGYYALAISIVMAAWRATATTPLPSAS